MDRPSNAAIATEPATNGIKTLPEQLEQLHQDLEIGYQTNRALIDVLTDMRDEARLMKPIIRDARIILADLAGELRAARFERGGEFADLESREIPHTLAELQALRDKRAKPKRATKKDHVR